MVQKKLVAQQPLLKMGYSRRSVEAKAQMKKEVFMSVASTLRAKP